MKDGTSPRNKELPRIRMAWDELEAIRANAREQGLSVSEYVRRVAIEGKIVHPVPRVDVDAVRELLRVGNNLNQLTKAGHVHGEINQAALKSVLDDLRNAVTELVKDY